MKTCCGHARSPRPSTEPRSTPSFLVFVLALALVATPATATTLRVVDAEGEPLAGARVQVFAPPAGSDPLSGRLPPLLDGRSDERGRLAATLPRLESLLLLVDHREHAPLVRAGSIEPDAGPIILGRGRRWSGRLRFEGEPPVEPGEICARWRIELAEWGRARVWRRCAPVAVDGSFELVGLPPGAVEVEARLPGFLPRTETVEPDRRALLRLARGVLLRGRVTSGGSPIGGAEIRARSGAHARSDDQGTFEIPVPTLPASLEVAAAGFRTVRERLDDPTDAEKIRVRLVPGEQLVGIVTDPDGRPPSELRVRLELHESSTSRQSWSERVDLGEEGELLLDLPQPGVYHLLLRAAGLRGERLPEIAVAIGESYDLGPIVLRPGATVRGTLVDAASGEPVPGTAVQLMPRGTELLNGIAEGTVVRTVSDDEGVFELAGLGGGGYELRLRHADFAPVSHRLSVETDQRLELGELTLERGTLLLGRLHDRAGKPRPGLMVRIFDPERESLLPIAERTSDAEGVFTGPSLTSGVYRLQVFGERLLLGQEIEVPANEETLPLELVIDGVRVEGVVSRHGEPLGGGLLTLAAALDPGQHRGKLTVYYADRPNVALRYGVPETALTTEVAADGTFAFDSVPAGAVWASHQDRDGVLTTRQLTVPDRARATLVVEIGGATLRGRVVDEQGIGVEAASVRILEPAGRRVSAGATDLAGRFVIDDVEPGTYAVQAAADGFVTRTRRGVSVDGDGPPLEIVLPRGSDGSLEIRLRRGDGSPVARVMVTLLDAGGRMVSAATTDALGERLFGHLPAGDYFAVWSDPVSGTASSAPIRVGNETPARLDEVLVGGASLRLACDPERCGGAAIEYLALFTERGIEIAPYLSGLTSVLRFSTAGELTLGRLGRGGYRLRLWLGGEVWERSFTVGSEPVRVVLP